MTTPTHVTPAEGTPAPMSPERWRAVDAILQTALACEPERRVAVIAELCGDDGVLRLEVASLLAEHVDADDDFLERPAAELFVEPNASPLIERLATAIGGRYRMEREIAHGGMATVYLAHDLKHGRRVAIKVLREEVAAAVGAERFLAEIRVTASLQHPHIPPLFDSGSADGVLWYAMPYVDGETLRSRLIRDGALPIAEAVRLAREVAEALDHAHVRGIVHRDVKPENVLLQDGHALVADFGIALALEQAGGERVLDSRVDVYALGAVLHEMLAGEPPFSAPTRQAVVRRMMHEIPPALTERCPEVPPFVEAAVGRALAKRPDDRFPNAAAFAASLAVPSTAPRGRTVSAQAALYAVAATLVAGLVGGLIIDRVSFDRPTAKPASMVAPPSSDIRAVPSVTPAGDVSLSIVDRTGHLVRGIPANRPWTPRFSPDGHRVAYGAFGHGRTSSDIWVTDLDKGTTQRLTDDDADSNDPQWSADGAALAFSVNAPGGKDVVLRPPTGGANRVVTARDGTQFPSDWLRDGSALLVTDGDDQHDILAQPADGSPARALVATPADETAARISPDGRWVAYTSDESGRAEVYLDSYQRPGRARAMISLGGGVHPVWRADGRELYYWRDGALIAVRIAVSIGGAPPVSGAQTVLFRAKYQANFNTMYDVSPDGQRFVIVVQH